MSWTKKLFTVTHFLAALLVGTLDIAAACVQYFVKTGKSPVNVIRYIASGAFGSNAYNGAVEMIAWGLFFHYLIAAVFSFLFFALMIKFPSLLKTKIMLAIAYGSFIWAVMRFAVMPFARLSPPPVAPDTAATAILILIVCIAVPLILIASKERAKIMDK